MTYIWVWQLNVIVCQFRIDPYYHLVTHSFSFVTGYHVSLYGVFKKVTCEWVELYRLGFKITYEFLPSEKAKDSIKSYLSVAKLCLSPSSNGFTIHSITSRSVAAKKTLSHTCQFINQSSILVANMMLMRAYHQHISVSKNSRSTSKNSCHSLSKVVTKAN